MRIFPAVTRLQGLTPGSASLRGHLALAASIASGAWAVILIRLAQDEGIPSLLIGAFRLTLAALILTPLILRNYRDQVQQLNRSDWLHGGTAGILMALLLATAAVALEHTTVLVTAVLFAINPLWVALLEMFLLKAPMKQSVWLGMGLTLAGSLIIALSGSGNLSLGQNPVLGAALALFGSLAVALYAVVGRKVRHRISLMPYMWLVFVTGAVTAVVILVLSGTAVGGHSAMGYLWLIVITLVTQITSHMSYNYALRHLSATYCSIFGQLEVLVSVALAFLLFSEIPVIWQLPGTIAILVGVAVVSLSSNKPTGRD
jgi:drug/metabolite transporter (DMT)-like permease